MDLRDQLVVSRRQHGRKKTKNDPMASGSATEANTRWKKKGKNDPKAYGPAVEVDNVTYEQPHYTDLVRDFSYI